MELRVQPEEAALLRQILTSYLSDLKAEISNTEDYDLRQYLKGNEAIVKGLIGRLEQMGVKAA